MDDSRATVRISIPSDPTLPMGLPPELSMLEPPPPIGEDSTQPLPLQIALREAESEIRVILGDPQATVAMRAGAPATPAASTQILPIQPPAGATQILNVGEPIPEPLPATQVLPVGPPPADPLQTQVIPDSYYLKNPVHPQPSPKKGLPWWGWAIGAAVLLGASFGGTMLLLPGFRQNKPATKDPETALPPTPPSAAAPSQAPAPIVIPPNLRPYYAKAEKGDAAAMRTLGVMYFYGMNVPKNTEEGLRWYRKAAEAGSAAAKKELKAIEVK